MSLKDLRRINVIVGDNGSGKTALLEALYLSAYAQPQGATLVRVARNRPVPQQEKVVWSRAFFHTFWEDLFYDFSHSRTVNARFTDSLHGELEVDISFEGPVSEPAFSETGSIPWLVFRRNGPKGTESGKLRIDEHGIPVYEGQIVPMPAVYGLSSTFQFYHLDIANFYSELCRQKAEDIVIKAFREEFPQVSDIVVLPDGTANGLFVSLDSIKNVRIPLAVVSSGAARYLNILVAIALHKNGVILIDEIENGLYWKKMPMIWTILRNLCNELNVQLFVTTHSNECLQSLMPAMKDHEDDFSLIRTEIVKGEYKPKQFYGKTFRAALEIHGEVR